MSRPISAFIKIIFRKSSKPSIMLLAILALAGSVAALSPVTAWHGRLHRPVPRPTVGSRRLHTLTELAPPLSMAAFGDTDAYRPRPARRALRAVRRLGGTLIGRCDDVVCHVVSGPGSLLTRLRLLLPRRRPIQRLRMCEEGTIKVKRVGDGTRHMYMVPHANPADECQLDYFDIM